MDSATLQAGLTAALKRHLPEAGWATEYRHTWRAHRMTMGVSIPSIRASGKNKGCRGWPSPLRADARTPGPSATRQGGQGLTATADLAGWPTPNATDHKGEGQPEGRRPVCDNDLPSTAALAGWPTPMAGSPETEAYNAAGNTDSSRKTVELVGWPTPAVSDTTGAKSPEQIEAMKAKPRATGGPPGVSNLKEAAQLAGWATPTAHEKARSDEFQQGRELNPREALGTPTPSSPAGTARRGVLNPDFTRWLMGYPAGWQHCADMATASSRKSRRRSSKRS